MVVAVPAAAATFVEFGTPTASGTFGQDIVFSQPATADRPVERVELLVTYADGLGPEVIPVSGAAAAGALDLRYTLSVDRRRPHPAEHADHGRAGGSWRRGRAASATAPRSRSDPRPSLVYADTRFDWKTASGDIVRVHWYEGGDAFGQRALAIGEEGVESAAKLLGVTGGRAGRLLHLRGPGRRSTTPWVRGRARTSAARPMPRSGRCSP